jgi:Bacterial SH3 domain
MNRILTIPGRSAAARRARLERVAAWMATRGWRLADYSDEAGSALFERGPDAPRLGPLDATRWLPGPGALRPGQWLLSLRADPRLAVLPGAVLVLALLLGVVLLGPRRFDADALQRREAARNWFVVTADQLNVRDGPDERRQQVGVLYKGQRVLVEGTVAGDWVRISIPDEGYVAKAFLAPAPPAAGED